MQETSFLAAVLFLICAVIAGTVIQWGVSKVKSYKPPVSILWFIFGMLLCLLELWVIPKKHALAEDGVEAVAIDVDPHKPFGLMGIGIAEAARVQSHLLYHIILPILLYDATQQISWYHFRKSLKVGLLLAIGGVIFQVVVIGYLMQWSFSQVSSSEVASATPASTLRELFSPPGLPQFDTVFNYSSLAEDGTEFGPAPSGLASFGKRLLAAATSASSKPNLAFSMMTAAAVASTDPIAVISILEEMEAPHHFASLFDCEALINDGSSIFLFSFFESLTGGKSTTVGASIQRFATLLFVGPLFGFLVACLMYRWLRHFHFHPYDETLAVVFMSYLVFYIAEIYLHTSGPLAIVVYGLYFKAYAKAAFEPATMDVHAHLVRGLATAATSVVFIISGIASVRMMWDSFTSKVNLELPLDLPQSYNKTADGVVTPNLVGSAYGKTPAATQLWRVPVFYLFLIGARFLMIGMFYPIIRKTLGEFSWKQYILLSWGGLRGAVCLILALVIEQDREINPDLSALAALYIASSAFLILLLNGISFEFVMKLLKPFQANPFKQVYLKRVMKFIDREYFVEVAILQQHWLFKDSWALVYADRLVPRLGKIDMDVRGRIHLELPNVAHTIRELDGSELDRCRISVPAKSSPLRTSPSRYLITPLPTPQESVLETALSKDRSDSLPGHTAAAVVQKLRRAPDQPLDLEKNLELLCMEDEEPNLNGMNRQLTNFREDVANTASDANSPRASESHKGRRPSDVSEEPAALPFGAHGREVTSVTRDRVWSPQPHSSSRRPARLGVTFQEQGTASDAPFKRIPGYRNDFVARIRSEPYGGFLDAAHLERLEGVRAVGRGEPTEVWSRVGGDVTPMGSIAESRGEAGPAQGTGQAAPISVVDWDSKTIPRTMSVPNQIASRIRREEQQDHVIRLHGNDAMRLHREVKPRDRDGEIVIMVVNTMRQLYKRMLDQWFISGTCYVGFMAVADVVSDFAILDVAKKSNLKAWRDVVHLEKDGYFQASGQDIEELEERSVVGEAAKPKQRGSRFRGLLSHWCPLSRQQKMERMSDVFGTITGFDVEWKLVEARLHGFSQSRWEWAKRLRRRLSCRRTPIEKPQPGWVEKKSAATAGQPTRYRRWWRRFWTTVWSWLGPRQIFPALDDLQCLCAFVDVHEEMLMRGDRGLRLVLGETMLSAFESQVEKARESVYRLENVYPDSIPFAILCHGAIFLVNLKIQLVEEFFEKGLLLSEDKDKISEALREQLITITKFHPYFLFT